MQGRRGTPREDDLEQGKPAAGLRALELDPHQRAQEPERLRRPRQHLRGRAHFVAPMPIQVSPESPATIWRLASGEQNTKTPGDSATSSPSTRSVPPPSSTA